MLSVRFLLAAAFLLLASTAQAGSGYHVIERLQLGGEGGWDYLAVDSSAGRLYVSRGTHVVVVDTTTDRIVGEIPDTPGVHGIALAPALNRGFISNGKANTAYVFDLHSLKVIGRVKTGENPDAVLYDPATKRVFTFNGGSHGATVFDACSEKVLATIPLGGKPEYAVSDREGRVFVNIEDRSEVVELDSRKLAVVKRYSLSPGTEPTGLAIDTARHRLFAGCRNRKMTVLDTESGQVIATLPIGEGVDGVAYEAETGLVFSSNGDGTLTVVSEPSPGKFETEFVFTQQGARTMALDPKTHTIYLPTATFAPAPPVAPGALKPRPTVVKDSFTVLVVGR